MLLKLRPLGTDDHDMADINATDTYTDPTSSPARLGGKHGTGSHLLLDGDIPRLASAPTMTPPQSDLMSPSQPLLPTPHRPDARPTPAPAVTLPTLPTFTATHPHTVTDTDSATATESEAEPQHPMAHLMPKKSLPSEASRRAAEVRAVRKAKAKKIKISVAAGLLVVTVLVGPPLARWFAGAINEAGSTTTVDEGTD